jgi:aminoglycoside 3-N-acetyltransferase
MRNETVEQIDRETIGEQLRQCGINVGDKIVMHSNLQSLGKARHLTKLPNCGADALIDGFLDVIGPDGLLCVPTFTRTFASPSSGPCGEKFDADTTPSRVGSITNVFLQRPGRARSLHPTHSWAALGAQAAEFVAGHDRSTVFGRDSLCGRMYDWDFKIVWFGTSGTTNTSTHFAEDWLDLPYMATEDALVRDGDGFRKVPVFRAPSGPREFYANGCKLDGLLEEWRLWQEGRVHQAQVRVMRHRDFMNRLLRAMMKQPCLLMADGKEDAYHQQFYALNTEHMRNLLEKQGGADGVLAALDCRQD